MKSDIEVRLPFFPYFILWCNFDSGRVVKTIVLDQYRVVKSSLRVGKSYTLSMISNPKPKCRQVCRSAKSTQGDPGKLVMMGRVRSSRSTCGGVEWLVVE